MKIVFILYYILCLMIGITLGLVIRNKIKK
jgi:uncharacterized protein YneF (UPF0154 family)